MAVFVSLYIARRDVYDLHHATLGDCFCLCLCLMFLFFCALFLWIYVYCVINLCVQHIGVIFAVLITATITDVIKNAVGRPRPDFFWRCFPDGRQVWIFWPLCVQLSIHFPCLKTLASWNWPDTFLACLSQLYDQVTGGVICHGEKSFLTDGRKSFPSGHTSCKFYP